MRRSSFLLATVFVGAILATNFGAGATNAQVGASAFKTVAVGGDKVEVAGGFAFDPVLKNGNFIAGVLYCAAVGINVTNVTISKCYIVASTGATFTTNPKSNAKGVVLIDKVLQNVPAVNLTQCITATAFYKDGTKQVVHLASAPKGEPVLPCKLG